MSRHCGTESPRTDGGTAVAEGLGVTDSVEVTAVVGPVTRNASVRPTISTKGVVPLQGYPVPGVTWRDPSPFT